MPFEKARQSLSDLENRLRVLFGLAGPIGASLDARLTPVLIAGDLREPGVSFSRGRSFAYSHEHQTNAGTTYHSVQFNADVLIEAVQGFTPLGGQALDCYITIPGESPAVAMSRTAGAWRDRKTSTTDIPPIQDSGALYAARTGTDQAITNRILSWNGVPVAGGNTAIDPPLKPVLMMLTAGSALNFRIQGTTANQNLCIYGRIWT